MYSLSALRSNPRNNSGVSWAQGKRKSTFCIEIKIKQKKHSCSIQLNTVTILSSAVASRSELPAPRGSLPGLVLFLSCCFLLALSGIFFFFFFLFLAADDNRRFGCKRVKFQLWLNCPFKTSRVFILSLLFNRICSLKGWKSLIKLCARPLVTRGGAWRQAGRGAAAPPRQQPN